MIANWLAMSLVAVRRIEKYLHEDEVPNYVSSLKRDVVSPKGEFDDRLGFTNATFQWSGLPKKKVDAPKPSIFKRAIQKFKWKKSIDAPAEAEETEEDDRPFEIKESTVVFPSGKLSLIVGPTGSGKSSCEFYFHYLSLLPFMDVGDLFYFWSGRISVLSAILGEMNLVSGEVYLPKEPTRLNPVTGFPQTISYCAQQPWLEHRQ